MPKVIQNCDLNSYVDMEMHCSNVNLYMIGVTRLLLMPGQRLAAHIPRHIHMSIFIWTSVFFSKYVVLAILYARYLS